MPLRRPLSPSILHILLALAEGPRHGYAIKLDVETRSKGSLRMGPGTLYESIQRLLEAGMVREADADAEPVNGQAAQRRYYDLTVRGRRVLGEEIEQWSRLVNDARERLEPA